MKPLKKSFLIFIISCPYISFGQDEDYVQYDIDPSLIVYYDSVNPRGSNYNFNEPVFQIGSKLKSSKLPDCYADLLSISNLESNYLFKKVKVPKVLLDFLIAKKIVSAPLNTKELKREVFLLARYIYSIQFDSYLLMFKEHNNKYQIKKNNLILINIKDDIVLSLSAELASYVEEINSTKQRYSIYQNNNNFFENYIEEKVSDVKWIKKEDKVEVKHSPYRKMKIKITIDSITGRITIG